PGPAEPVHGAAPGRMKLPARAGAAGGAAVLALASAAALLLLLTPVSSGARSGGVEWEERLPGMEWGTVELPAIGIMTQVKAVVVSVDPAVVTFELAGTPAPSGPPHRWTIADAPGDVVVSLNAGQFGPARPWGWLVRNGVEVQPPGTGPLAPALAADTSGQLRFIPADSIAAVRAAGTTVLAFQSYPTLFEHDGRYPAALEAPGRGVDLEHRDARLAIGETADGQLLLVLTRFDGLGGLFEELPIGLTTPEMAALMRRLGARRAVLLDGGVSSQLALNLTGRRHVWPGYRRVPIGLVGKRRDPQGGPPPFRR